jgi:hypothetical protein
MKLRLSSLLSHPNKMLARPSGLLANSFSDVGESQCFAKNVRPALD